MAKSWFLLISFIVAAATLPAGAIGRVDDTGRVGIPDWAVGPQGDGPVAVYRQGEPAQAQALGGGVGLPEHIRERLTNRESLGAAVGLSDPLRERLMNQGVLGAASGAPAQIQELLMNREALGAAVGMPVHIRERLMAMLQGL